MTTAERIIIALDVRTERKAQSLVEMLIPHVKIFKIGLELTTAIGIPRAVEIIREAGGGVFLDTKMYDTRRTIKRTVQVVASLGIDFFTIDLKNELKVLEDAVKNCGTARAIGVTLLTDMTSPRVRDIFHKERIEKVVQLALEARVNGLRGIICATHDLPVLRQKESCKNLLKIVMGVQYKQTREDIDVATPAQAFNAGASYVVIGRSIIQARSEIGTPADAARQIIESVKDIIIS